MQNRQTNTIDDCLAVFQGGGCKAVAYIGAYKALRQNGVVISEVAGTSAGAIIAALIAAGAYPDDIERFLNSLDFKKIAKVNFKARLVWSLILILICIYVLLILGFVFGECIGLFRATLTTFTTIALLLLLLPLFLNHGYNSTKTLRKILNKELCTLVGKNGKDDVVCFKDLNMPLSVVTADLKHHNERIFCTNTNPRMSVSRAVCSSCAIPFFFQPISKIFVDGGLVSNSPIHLFSHHPSYHRILSFQLKEAPQKVNEKSFCTFLRRLISTIIDGAKSLQEGFGIQVDYIIIPVKELTATSFSKLSKKNIVENAINDGYEQTEKELIQIQGKKLHSLHANALNDELKSYDQLYSLIATYSKEKVSEVVVSTPDTKWVWHIYPTLVKWANDKADIYVYCLEKKNHEMKTNEEIEREFLLTSLGCKYNPLPKLEANAFFIQIGGQWRGAIFDENYNEQTKQQELIIGCYYDHFIDSTAIKAWVDRLEAKNAQVKNVFEGEVALQKEDADAIIGPLQLNCPMYATAHMTYKTLKWEELEELLFLTDKIRLYKYRQIGYLFDLHDDIGIPYFSPAKLKRPSTINAVIGPIVIEHQDGKDYVIEGHTRLLYAYMNNIKEIEVLYVKNATVPIEIPNGFKPRTIKQLIVSDNKKHDKSNNPNFRHIEAALRKSMDTLPEQA